MLSKFYPEPEWDHQNQYYVIKRNRQLSNFDANKIAAAMNKAFIAVEGKAATASNRIQTTIQSLTTQVISAISRYKGDKTTIPIEDIQDQVELALMRAGFHKVARAYVLYREEHAHLRSIQQDATPITITDKQGERYPLDENNLKAEIVAACMGLDDVNPELLFDEVIKNIFDGISETDLNQAMILCTRTLIESEPNYTYVAARLLLNRLRAEAFEFVGVLESDANYQEYFKLYINAGIKHQLLTPELNQFDLDRLGQALIPERDKNFTYLGLQTLYDRYFLHCNGVRLEMPQAFFMRVAMGISLKETNRDEQAIEFYQALSNFDFMCSTPTLFNSGTLRPQLSSCFLTTVPDDLAGIYDALKDDALLSKHAGGLGNDWTPVRGMGAYIRGTNGKSQGVVPFLKVANDTLVACNQSSKRRGAGCAYLEIWHIDIEEFLELRKNTGDERRRTHDMNTANWIPDEFMFRVHEDRTWTLFSPDEVPELHDLYGKAFSERYAEYEQQAQQGKLRIWKQVSAVELWRKMLTMLFETGSPWLTFKDACNLRNPQQHDGVVHSSNLCCIAADQRVVTDRGLITIGELFQQGGKNKVVGLNGINNASEMFLPRPNAPMVQIETKEGYTHKVTPDHKVWVKDKGWVEAQNLVVGEKLLIQQLEGLWGSKHNPELAYIMGLIAGDGTFGKHQVCVDLWEHDFGCIEEVTQKIHYLLDSNTALNTSSTNTPEFCFYPKQKKARLNSAPLYRLIEANGMTKKTKTRVPQLIWQGTRETVAEYLRGLYQTDGHIQASKEVTSLVISSKDLVFIRELQILWANFGVKSSINKMRDYELKPLPDGRGSVKDYLCKPMYRLLITSIQACKIAESVTHLGATKNSKVARQYLENIKKEGYTQKLYTTFTGLTELPNEDAYCLTVDSETHAWTVNGLITKNTEITLNTKAGEEIGVCNLASINLPNHISGGKVDVEKLKITVNVAMRALDNVIDVNFYAVDAAKRANQCHRPVGLGIMGFQDALYKLGLPYASQEAVEFADKIQELVSYFAISASCDLAQERGKYQSFEGSFWHQGILPIDSIKLLAEARNERGEYLEVDTKSTLDWDSLRERVKQFGMRNSNTMAIAPTATISLICGVSQSIEPTYQNLFVKSNLSGEFTMINPYLIEDLKNLDLWDEVMLNDLKFYDGRLKAINRIPENLKAIYATAFEIDSTWLIKAASRRQKWIDQAQSLNLYLLEPSGRKLDSLYKLAWKRGLKTTYYLRAMGATHIAKSTITPITQCNIDDVSCEACQ